jgi:hypothetical protein
MSVVESKGHIDYNMGNRVKSIIVAAITAGIATRYPLSCVKRNRMTEK